MRGGIEQKVDKRCCSFQACKIYKMLNLYILKGFVLCTFL